MMDFFGIEWFFGILSCLLVALALIYKFYTEHYKVFEKRAIPYLKPSLIVGNLGQRVMKKISYHDFNIWLYEQFKGQPHGGFFERKYPRILIRDPELIEKVLIEKFDHFVDRNTRVNQADPEIIKKMMINLKGNEWKTVREKLTPVFSSEKLHSMENLLQECGKEMVNFLNQRKDPNEMIEMTKIFGKYALEAIGCCVFGLDHSLMKNSKFMSIASQIGNISSFQRLLLNAVGLLCPDLMKHLPLSEFRLEDIEYFKKLLIETEKTKEKSIGQSDFLEFMLNLAEKEKNDQMAKRVMTDDVIFGQTINFLLAGYETTIALLSFACYFLAMHRNIQKELRNQLLKIPETEKHLCNALKSIELLEKVLLETLRMYPPISRVERTCTKPLNLPEANIDIKVGDVVVIPVAGIHQDPKYYPEPDKFDPGRFSFDEKRNRPSHSYLPFGLGPRNCIGSQFAMMSAKFALYHLLRNYHLELTGKSEFPITINVDSFVLKAENGIHLRVKSLPK